MMPNNTVKMAIWRYSPCSTDATGNRVLGILMREIRPLLATILPEACDTDLENRINTSLPQIRKARKFTFTPQNFEAGGLPDPAPLAMAAILEHGEMYED